MENTLKTKCKYRRCVEWNVQLPDKIDSRIVSQTFLFQSRNCNLEFYTGYIYKHLPHLRFKSDSELQLPVTVSLHILRNSKTYSQQTVSITEANQLIWKDETNVNLVKDHMIFELTFNDDSSNVTSDDKSSQTPSYLDTCFLTEGFARDFSKMLDESSNQDVEFICGGQTIKAHKSVLSCRSDVFASMLQSDMSEGRTGRINIQDMDAKLFQQFLKCLYTGVLPELTVDTALKFYEVGDKYNVDPLKKQCADFLIDHLLAENACDMLILADQHSDAHFKRSVIDFIIKEKLPYSGEKWPEFSKQYPVLAVEVFTLFCQHLCSK